MSTVRREVYVAAAPVETPPIGCCESGFLGGVCAGSANGSSNEKQTNGTSLWRIAKLLLGSDDDVVFAGVQSNAAGIGSHHQRARASQRLVVGDWHRE